MIPTSPPVNKRHAAWLILMLALHILPFATRPALIGGDEPHYALMAHSLGVERDAHITNNYDEVEAGSNAAGHKRAGTALVRHTRTIGNAEVFAHPLGLPLLAAPLVAIQEAVLPGSAPDILLGLLTLGVTFAALIVGWRLLVRLTADGRDAALLLFCVYFGSPLWFYSRTFFTEPYTWAFAVFAIACIVRGRLVAAAGFLALTLAMKETSLLIVAPILLVSAQRLGMRKAAVLAAGPLVFAALFALKNYLLVGTPFSTFHPYIVGNPITGAIGLLLDSMHGLIWFAPLLFLGIFGWLRRGGIPTDLRAGAFLAFVSYFALTAAWADWRGGSSYATRLLLPVLPALVIPLAGLVFDTRFRRLLFPLFLIGFVVNWCAALDPFKAFWGVNVFDLLSDNPAVPASGLIVGALFYYVVAEHFPSTRIVLPLSPRSRGEGGARHTS